LRLSKDRAIQKRVLQRVGKATVYMVNGPQGGLWPRDVFG
jgi:hypothetical protein